MVEYYDEALFSTRGTLDKYRCNHCQKVPKVFYRCQCGKVDADKLEPGKRKTRFEGNTGLSCGECVNKPCISCKSNKYELDKITGENIRRLGVICPQGCGNNPKLYDLNNHITNSCSKRKRICKYDWAGCEVEGAGEEIEEHEKDKSQHFDMVVSDLKGRIESLERAVAAFNTQALTVPTPQSLSGEQSTQQPQIPGPSAQ